MNNEFRKLTLEEIKIAKEKFNMINPIYRGVCPICGKALVEDERYDGYYPEVVDCINCVWHEDEFNPFDVISGITEEEVKLIHSAVIDKVIDITDDNSITNLIKYCYKNSNMYGMLGDALIKYYAYKIRYEEYHNTCKMMHRLYKTAI